MLDVFIHDWSECVVEEQWDGVGLCRELTSDTAKTEQWNILFGVS